VASSVSLCPQRRSVGCRSRWYESQQNWSQTARVRSASSAGRTAATACSRGDLRGPAVELPRMAQLIRRLNATLTLPVSNDRLASANHAVAELDLLLERLLRERAVTPRDDLLSALLTAQHAGLLDHEELLGPCHDGSGWRPGYRRPGPASWRRVPSSRPRAPQLRPGKQTRRSELVQRDPPAGKPRPANSADRTRSPTGWPGPPFTQETG
jgi:hypothetical protein